MDDLRCLTESIESLPFGLMVISAEGTIVYSNRCAGDKFGLAKERLNGRRADDLSPVLGRLFRACLKSGQSCNRALRLRRRDLWVEALPMGEKSPIEGILFLIDLKTRFDTAGDDIIQSLRSQELDAIFNLSSDGILLCDGAGYVITINSASERINGWKSEEVVGRNVRDLVRDRYLDKSVTLEVMENRTQINMVQYVGKTRKHLLVTGTPLLDEKGDLKLVVVNERDMTQLNSIQERLEENRKVTEKYRDELIEMAALESGEREIIAESPNMKQVLKYALKLARLDASNILLLGESGTGKGLLAKFIHDHSGRLGNPLIQINCAALPESLLEAELFGYEKGAYTGAGEQGKAGLFELAQDGTLFLDEIGDCPISIQAKLLKYLDDHEVLRLGSVTPKIIDCNIIAATNRDMERLIEKGAFRSDLFYRLNTFTIQIPPIRQRPEDTFELIRHFLDEFNSRYGLKRKISTQALRRLQNHDYPGNVRELENIVKQAVVMSDSDILDNFILGGPEEKAQASGKKPQRDQRLTLTEQVEMFEKKLLKKTAALCRSTREMAGLLGTSQPTVVRRLKKYGLPLPSKRN